MYEGETVLSFLPETQAPNCTCLALQQMLCLCDKKGLPPSFGEQICICRLPAGEVMALLPYSNSKNGKTRMSLLGFRQLSNSLLQVTELQPAVHCPCFSYQFLVTHRICNSQQLFDM